METPKRKILFLGETFRADAITWMNGLKEFGNFEIISWELKTPNNTFVHRMLRVFEFSLAYFSIKKIVKQEKPDMVIAERTTSYGFLAAISGVKPIAIAQQGRTDLWPENAVTLPLKRIIQNYAFKKATLIHAWGPLMTVSMQEVQVDMKKVLILPKGIDLEAFENHNTANPKKINAIVTRSLQPEYCHDCIIEAFALLKKRGFDFSLTIVGYGKQLPFLKMLTKELAIDKQVCFTGRIPNSELPKMLQQANFYISMPITEGVSASLFEAMACQCYPIVSNNPGNQSWINHRENGQLITLNDAEMLANELLWAFENESYRMEAVQKNRLFVEKNANYSINMKQIAMQYHQLINLFKSN